MAYTEANYEKFYNNLNLLGTKTNAFAIISSGVFYNNLNLLEIIKNDEGIVLYIDYNKILML